MLTIIKLKHQFGIFISEARRRQLTGGKIYGLLGSLKASSSFAEGCLYDILGGIYTRFETAATYTHSVHQACHTTELRNFLNDVVMQEILNNLVVMM